MYKCMYVKGRVVICAQVQATREPMLGRTGPGPFHPAAVPPAFLPCPLEDTPVHSHPVVPSFNLALHKHFRSTCSGRESGEQGKVSAFIEMTFSGTANHQVNIETS